eukprot:Nk52_evm31s1444 gene=Nk52_evmTU31s1444
MSLHSFSGEKFDVRQYINNALGDPDMDSASLESTAHELLLKLQLNVLALTEELDERSQQVTWSIPKIVRDADGVKQEAVLLKEKMNLVKADLEKVEMETGKSMKMLMQMDLVKSRLESCSSALKEAENWTALSNHVDEIFVSQDIKEAASKLKAMHESLSRLTNVPDYEERKKRLDGLENKLEAMMSPLVVESLNNHSTEKAKEYFKIFEEMGRKDEMRKYYFRCHKSQALKSWKNFTSGEKDIAVWLPEFFSELLDIVKRELGWAEDVFTCNSLIHFVVLEEILKDLTPSFKSCIRNTTVDEGQVLVDVAAQHQVVVKFLNDLLEVIVECDRYSTEFKSFIETLYDPFLSFLMSYGALEKQWMLNTLKEIKFNKTEFMDIIREVSTTNTKVFGSAQVAMERCFDFTGGIGCKSYAEALSGFFGGYRVLHVSVLRTLRKQCKLPEQIESALEAQSSVFEHDWSSFHGSLRLIEICGDILLEFESVESKFKSNVVSSLEKFGNEMRTGAASRGLDRRSSKEEKGHCVHNYLKSKPEEYLSVVSFMERSLQNSMLLNSAYMQLLEINNDSQKFAFDTMFFFVLKNLKEITVLNWELSSDSSAIVNDLPSFSLSPLNYITQIGEHLLTLPQELESFVNNQNESLLVALNLGRVPFEEESKQCTGGDGEYNDDDDGDGKREANSHADIDPVEFARKWIGAVSYGTMHYYTGLILDIKGMNDRGRKQLSTDINYIENVFSALDIDIIRPLEYVRSIFNAADVAEVTALNANFGGKYGKSASFFKSLSFKDFSNKVKARLLADRPF